MVATVVAHTTVAVAAAWLGDFAVAAVDDAKCYTRYVRGIQGKGTQEGIAAGLGCKIFIFFWVILVALIHTWYLVGGKRLREGQDEAIMGKPIQGMRTRTSRQSGARLEVLGRSASVISSAR